MRTKMVLALLLAAVTADLKVRTTSEVVQAATPNATITAVPGIKGGHFTLTERPTGCTLVLVGGDAGGGVSQRGGAPRRRENDLLNPRNMGGKRNAIVLAGGSAVGDIIDPATGKVVAGVRNPDGTFADARKILRGGTIGQPRAGENTTIGVVATNAKLSRALAARMALMADDGYARAISPSHTN